MRRLYSLYRRAVHCRRHEHRETIVCVFGEFRFVCLDCPHARTIGHVFHGASNSSHPFSP